MKALNSIRIGFGTAENLPYFKELLEILAARRDMAPQISLFMAVSHPPMPLSVAGRQAEVLKDRMVLVREYGFESGINILSTIGHHEENLDNSLQEEYTRMTNIDGQLCGGSFCPNDEGMRGYIEKLYRLICAAEPDYIWIDDDVRFGHMPIGYGCFCDRCLEIFEEEYGRGFTRERLKAAFNDGTPAAFDLAKQWLQHNRNTLARLFTLIEKTVSEACKKPISLGFMTGERYYEGYDFAGLAQILKGEKRQIYWRPGGGAYTEDVPYHLIQKSHQIGRQVSLLPADVTVIQSEIENFMGFLVRKSPAATALEAACHIAAGCTGAAWNVLPSHTDEEPTDHMPMIDRLAAAQPFYDLLVETFGRTPPVGIYPGWTRDLQAVAGMTPGHFQSTDWLAGDHAKELLELGLPVAYDPDSSRAATLCGDSVRAMPAELIRKLLSGGVYLDPKALIHLNDMGYGEYTGFAARGFIDRDCIEVYTDHPLNEGIKKGAERNCYQAFNKGDAAIIEITNPKAEVLSFMKDYSGNTVSHCCTGIFENAFGGRVCVAGYYAWEILQSLPKSIQLKAIFRYVSRDTLPSITHSLCRLHNWTRPMENGGMAAALVNGSLETLRDTVILLKAEDERCVAYDMRLKREDCRFLPELSGGGYKAFAIPVILPWEMILVKTR